MYSKVKKSLWNGKMWEISLILIENGVDIVIHSFDHLLEMSIPQQIDLWVSKNQKSESQFVA